MSQEREYRDALVHAVDVLGRLDLFDEEIPVLEHARQLLQRTGGMSAAEPPPTPSDAPAVWDLVIADMRERDADGQRKYGTRLRANNGRRTLRDAYQEALDLAVYLRQELYEREGR